MPVLTAEDAAGVAADEGGVLLDGRAAERFRAAQMLPAAERNADAMELAIIDVRRREVEALQRDSARQE